MNTIVYDSNKTMVSLTSGKTAFDSMVNYSERKSNVGFDCKNKRWFCYNNNNDKVYIDSTKKRS